MSVANDMLEYYASGVEFDRLDRGIGRLEGERTREVLLRYLPAPPTVVCDVGGAHGVYSFWLAEMGYEVHLVDPSPLHIEEAKRRAGEADANRPASITLGDARNLHLPDDVADVVMSMGPMYHLTEREDRLTALREAWRVLRPSGLLFVSLVMNYASTFVGLVRGHIWDRDYLAMCEQEVTSCRHVRPATWPDLFPDTHFHDVPGAESEITEAGFRFETILGLEGAALLIPNLEENWQEPNRREVLLRVARMMEKEPAHSIHAMAIAKK